MATNPIQLYLYMLMAACVIRLRKIYSVEDRKAMGLTVIPGGSPVMWLCTILVFAVSLFTIFVNGTDYFVTGFVVIIGGLVAYMLCKWFYKGRYLDNPDLLSAEPEDPTGSGRSDEHWYISDPVRCHVCCSRYFPQLL